MKVEYYIKQLSRLKKEELIQNPQEFIKDINNKKNIICKIIEIV